MAADTGTGKTVMALAHYTKHAPGYKILGDPKHYSHIPLLILAPASKVRTKDWEREAEEFGLPLDNITIISYEKATRKAGFNKWAQGAQPTWWMQWVKNNPEFVL